MQGHLSEAFPVRDAPLVSIITPCLNRAKFIEDAILSLRAQDYPYIEHVVMDGGSSDGTVEILRRYEDRLRWWSEPDQGQADAVNKALRLTNGEIIGWLNSDDKYLPGAVRRAVQIFAAEPDVDMFYGTCLLIDEQGRQVGTHSTKPFDVARLIWYDPGFFTIQSMFFRRRVLERVGEFDVNLHYALDYDWMIRVGKQCTVRYVPECLGAFRRHEEATQGKSHRAAYRREVVAVSRRHGGRLVTPVKFHLYEALVQIPGNRVFLPWFGPLKRVMSRFGIAPGWL